ncbi:nuclear pore glycoprotein p62 [Teleopsis dalmanni]|uniref:nuclear pore glycoprotein p62 n=1 Tax=Teleopsis dalmanni TaxID=139649 RepID=UPI0018CF7B8C|nr:nuclear pore glycoprotein p62 [Teleopsis dalmanni]
MSFLNPTTTASTGFSFGLNPTVAGNAATPPKTGFSFSNLGGGDAAAIKPLAFGVPSTTSLTTATTAPTLSIATTVTPATQPMLSLQKPADATPAQNTVVSAAPAVTTTGTGFANLSTATKTTDSSSITANSLTYNQLEEYINKWTLELEDQEKVFMDQATQINAWDKILISNNQKIVDLNDAVQKVKQDQATLEQELEFISTQHKELEESIVPLQKEFMKIPQVDVERSQTYLLVENLDTQLKQMSEDLKEIVDNLNETNKGMDNTDPLTQIGKILNAHMTSLQWIETSTENLGKELDGISKMHETVKRDSERSFRSAYHNK